MKERKIQTYWDGEPVWREETAEETLKRQLGVEELDLTAINLFIQLNENTR